jgi:DNA-binding response OmpR family regulator
MSSAEPRRRIALIVEDEPRVSALAATLFEEAGFEVAQVESAESAVGFMERNGAEVALNFVDIRLAGIMDGIDLARVVAKLWPAARLLVTSGVDAEHIRLERLPKAATYMPKPWRVLDVLTAARSVEGPPAG